MCACVIGMSLHHHERHVRATVLLNCEWVRTYLSFLRIPSGNKLPQ